MAVLNTDNPFQSWVLTPTELFNGQILSITQKQVIQNQIAQMCVERINLVLDPNNVSAFVQRDAELKGSIGALTYLINLSISAESDRANLDDPNLQE